MFPEYIMRLCSYIRALKYIIILDSKTRSNVIGIPLHDSHI